MAVGLNKRNSHELISKGLFFGENGESENVVYMINYKELGSKITKYRRNPIKKDNRYSAAYIMM